MVLPALRTIIADDEHLAREKLRILLAAGGGVEIIEECETGQHTIEAVRTHKPDLLFIDIRMPDIDGFEVLKQIPPEEMPAVVFTTAYDQFALRAFEQHALDYLLKPFEQERLSQTVERARTERLKSADRHLAERIVQLLSERQARPAPRRIDERLVIRTRGRVVFLDLAEIEWIEAAANYIKLHTSKDSHLVRESIGRFSESLDPRRFVRIHRSIIVNTRSIRELQPCDNGEYIAVLKNGKELSCSRGYRAHLQRLIQGNL
jgi:two-component system LytT family response regulator